MFFSDWSGKKCDFATNKYVAYYYGNRNVDYFGRPKSTAFADTIIKEKKVLVGVDYYIFSFGKNFFPQELLSQVGRDLARGKVFVYEVVLEGDRLLWKMQ